MLTGTHKRQRQKAVIRDAAVLTQPESNSSGKEPSQDSSKTLSLMLGSRIHPLFNDRNLETIPSLPPNNISKSSTEHLEGLQPPLRRLSGTFDPSVGLVSPDFSSEGASCDFLPSVNQSFVTDLQKKLTTLTKDLSSVHNDGISSRAPYPSSRLMFEHPIFSISAGDSRLVDLEAHPLDEGQSAVFPISEHYSSAYVQDLEPFSDSIITLFGSHSNFST
jgi:hypothetical protein